MPAHDDDVELGPWRIVAAIIFALLAIAFIVVGVAISGDHHSLRMVGSFLISVAFALGSWFALRYRSLALEEAREAEQAALAEAERAAAAGEQPPPPGQAGPKPTTAASQA